MDIQNLINAAKAKSGMPLGAMAAEMQISQVRISEWKKGKYRPNSGNVLYLAKKAGLNAIETLAEYEAEINPQFADLWKQAVSEIRQNQGLSRLRKIFRSVARKLQPKQRHKRKARKGPFLLVK